MPDNFSQSIGGEMSIFNSNLRDDLRNRIDELEQELAKLKAENEKLNARNKKYFHALNSIYLNTCCESCQEAKLVAKEALGE